MTDTTKDQQETTFEVAGDSSQLEQVYARLEKAKARRRELMKMCKDELSHNQQHQELLEEMKRLRGEKKVIEQDLRMNSLGIEQELDELKTEIQSDTELLADVALNMYTSGQNVEIVDEDDNRYVPLFKVTFKRQ